MKKTINKEVDAISVLLLMLNSDQGKMLMSDLSKSSLKVFLDCAVYNHPYSAKLPIGAHRQIVLQTLGKFIEPFVNLNLLNKKIIIREILGAFCCYLNPTDHKYIRDVKKDVLEGIIREAYDYALGKKVKTENSPELIENHNVTIQDILED